MLGPVDFDKRIPPTNRETTFNGFDHHLQSAYFPMPSNLFRPQQVIHQPPVPALIQVPHPGSELARRLFASMLRPYSFPQDFIHRFLPTTSGQQLSYNHQPHDNQNVSTKSRNPTFSSPHFATPSSMETQENGIDLSISKPSQSSPKNELIIPPSEDSFWEVFQRLQAHRMPNYSQLPSPMKPENVSPSSQSQKKRKSGFQAGVTVGYTYDAFFISDGRSRKRRSQDVKEEEVFLEGVTASSSASTSSTGFESRVSTPPTVSSLLQTSPEEVGHLPTRFTCAECGKHYATSSNLSRHKQTHRSFDSQLAKKCPNCGKLYVSMPALSMHILTHDLKHQCDICGKAFSRPWLLQGHRRAHTGEKPYGCAHCGRAFADRSNLRAHMQTHSVVGGAKEFECGQCGKTFALKTYLTKHLELSSSCCRHRQKEPKMLPLSIEALVGDSINS